MKRNNYAPLPLDMKLNMNMNCCFLLSFSSLLTESHDIRQKDWSIAGKQRYTRVPGTDSGVHGVGKAHADGWEVVYTGSVVPWDAREADVAKPVLIYLHEAYLGDGRYFSIGRRRLG